MLQRTKFESEDSMDLRPVAKRWYEATIGLFATTLVSSTIVAVTVTLLLHESGHTLVGIALGYPMEMDLNGSRPVGESFSASWHLSVIAAAGPVVTVLQSIGGSIWMARTGDRRLYPVVLFPLLYRLVPYVLSVARPARLQFQDEIIVANTLGIHPWLGPGVVLAVLGGCWWYAIRETPVSPRRTAVVGVLSVAFAALLIVITAAV